MLLNFDKWNKIDLFIDMQSDPLKKYNFFKIDFSKNNYMLILPESLSSLFSPIYSKIITNSIIFFPKDFEQAKELLNDFEADEGIKENWIIISPCLELRKNIETIHDNKNIIYFISYCPIYNHSHDEENLYKFSKYYGNVDSFDELIEKLFKLTNIFYYRRKQKYKNDYFKNDIIGLKYKSHFLIDLQNDGSKYHVTNEKHNQFFNFKMNNDKCFFSFIKSLVFLEKCLDQQDYSLLFNIIGKLSDLIILSDNQVENVIFSSIFLKNLHLLYIYFSNYPIIFGILTDDEINEILLNFKNLKKNNDLKTNIISGINSLTTIIDSLSFKVGEGKSILNEKEKLKNFHRLLIEINCSIEQEIQGFNIVSLCEFYQIKNYFRDIHFCMIKLLFNIFTNYCVNYPFRGEIISTFLNSDKRFFYYSLYAMKSKEININKETEENKVLNDTIKYKDIIVIGETNFHILIKNMNLPCKNIYNM